MTLFSACLILFFASASLHAEDTGKPLLIGTWGGPYEVAQRAALFTPFERDSGIRINTLEYTGGFDVFDEPVLPDVLDMLEEEAYVACRAGLLKKFDFASLSSATILPASSNHLTMAFDDFPEHDFQKNSFARCSVAHLTFSTLVAYDERAFNGEKPKRINDLFDLQRFPGKRALQRSPAALFEWAMMTEGVPVSQIYDLLSTERGLRLVLKRLENLRGQVIWWDTPAEAVALLERGDVVMASGYNGRFFEAWSRGAPVSMIWDGQIIDRSVWALPLASTVELKTALSFLRYALHPERLAHMSTQIPYGPLRKSAFRYIGLHPETGIVMSDHLPTADHHMTNALNRDTRWYARTSRLRDAYFSRWLNSQSDSSGN
ncbi:MAG: extracellular solute-binding protein [Granulosicoccus sp.]